MSGAREQLDSDQLERLQLRISRLEQQIALNPFIGGTRVTAQAIGNRSTTLKHMLPRTPAGFIVLNVTPPADIGYAASQPTDPTKFINLQASVACTADLWFF